MSRQSVLSSDRIQNQSIFDSGISGMTKRVRQGRTHLREILAEA